MFTIDSRKRMKIVKGDTAIFDIKLKDYALVDGDTVYFTVKTDVDDTEKIVQKIVTEFDNGNAKFILSKDDTNIEVGDYIYDIQCSLADGRVDTVIAPTKFTVLGGVTHE